MTVEVIRITAKLLMTTITMGKSVQGIVPYTLLGPAKIMTTVQAHAVFFVLLAAPLADEVISYPDASTKPMVCWCTLQSHINLHKSTGSSHPLPNLIVPALVLGTIKRRVLSGQRLAGNKLQRQ